MSPNKVEVEIRGSIDEYFEGIREEIPSVLDSFTQDVVKSAGEKSPGGSSGQIGSSLTADPARPVGPASWESGIISSDAQLVYWHEFGTGERKEEGGSKYPITPHKPPWALRFYWAKKGGIVFFKHVEHPGVKASRMLRTAIEEKFPTFLQAIVSMGWHIRNIGKTW